MFMLKHAAFLALSVSLATPHLVQADILRASSATATSEFSSSYDIGNTIDGSGLPANFGLLDAHATYTTNNHWTTATNRTIGESATFSFTMPAPVGGFHMWAHRSNGIASNPHYAVTRFDLVFRDAGGAVLATIPNLVGVPGVAIAQTYVFDVIQNVKTVQFIVRATANNNVSPFTGLAEVLFDTCITASASAPASLLVCPGGTATLSVTPAGSGPFTYRWERLGDSEPVTLTDGPLPGSGATVSGATTANLTISGIDPAATVGEYRCVVTNPCSETFSGAATITFCPADTNCDGFNDFFDYDQFVQDFEAGNPAADFNGDGFIDFFDYDDFVLAYETGC
jgi:hypothetical protein